MLKIRNSRLTMTVQQKRRRNVVAFLKVLERLRYLGFFLFDIFLFSFAN
jgi:hypothetical protein